MLMSPPRPNLFREQAGPSNDVTDAFRVAMGRLAAGVVMVTCHVDEEPWGLTVSACCSVSMEPPLLLVSLGSNTISAQSIERTGVFGVSLLGQELVGVAQFGASRGQAKFVHDFVHTPDKKCVSPLVRGSLAHIDCTVQSTVPAGDHTIVIGKVNQVVVGGEGDHPLVYYARTFHRLSELTDLHAAPVAAQSVDSLLYNGSDNQALSSGDKQPPVQQRRSDLKSND